MALETGTYISDLNSSNPDGADAVASGDDHIRLMKSILQNTFPTGSKALRLQVAGATVATSAVVTLTASDEGKCILAAATGTDAQTITLMQTAQTGYWVKVKNARVTAGAAVTVSPGGTETISSDGVTLVSGSVSLSKFGNEITLAWSGSSWNVIGSVSPLGEVDIPDLQASKITRGVFGLDRIPVMSLEKIPLLTADKIPDLSANKITSDELSLDRIPNITAAKLPDASTTAKGIVQLATDTEIIDGTVDKIPDANQAKNVIVPNVMLTRSGGDITIGSPYKNIAMTSKDIDDLSLTLDSGTVTLPAGTYWIEGYLSNLVSSNDNWWQISAIKVGLTYYSAVYNEGGNEASGAAEHRAKVTITEDSICGLYSRGSSGSRVRFSSSALSARLMIWKLSD